jgi:hypothetical protein
MRFKAAVLERVGTPLVVRDVTAEDLKPFDVLVRNKASGLCHTDLEIIQGQLAWPLPVILGHEGAGIVEAVGGDVSLVRPGDHVVCSWNPTCGHCFYCDRGQPILCEPHNKHNGQGALLDGGSRLALDGKRLNHFSAVSSHAECSVVHETSAIVVPKEIPFDRACLIGCGVMTGVGGAARMARIEAGASVAVIGCGAVAGPNPQTSGRALKTASLPKMGPAKKSEAGLRICSSDLRGNDISAEVGGLRYSEHVIGDGPRFRAQACKLGLEGAISKRPTHRDGWAVPRPQQNRAGSGARSAIHLAGRVRASYRAGDESSLGDWWHGRSGTCWCPSEMERVKGIEPLPSAFKPTAPAHASLETLHDSQS